MKKRAYKDVYGVKVVTFAENAKREGESEDEFIERAWTEMKVSNPLLPDEFVDLDVSELPPREDRTNWDIVAGKVIKTDK